MIYRDYAKPLAVMAFFPLCALAVFWLTREKPQIRDSMAVGDVEVQDGRQPVKWKRFRPTSPHPKGGNHDEPTERTRGPED